MMLTLVAILAIIIFASRRKGTFLQLTERGGMIRRKWGYLTGIAAIKWGIPENVIISVIGIESDGNEKLVGSANEIGLMQLLPSTFSDFEKDTGLKAASAFNPATNIDAGSWYLSKINQAFPLESWETKIEAYNTGVEGHRKGRRALDSFISRIPLFLSV